MYFRELAKVKLTGELTEEENKRVISVIEDVVVDYLRKKNRFNFEKDNISFIRKEKEGFLFLVESIFNKNPSNYEYFVSNFEFGPPRQFENDHRFAHAWKEHMLEYLEKYRPAFVEDYIKDWAEEYSKYRAILRKDVPQNELESFDKYTKYSCELAPSRKGCEF